MITRILDTDLDSEKRYVQNLVYIIYMYILYMIFRTCTLLQSTTGPMDPGLGKNRKTHLTNMLNDLQLSNENKKQTKNNGFLIKIVLWRNFPWFRVSPTSKWRNFTWISLEFRVSPTKWRESLLRFYPTSSRVIFVWLVRLLDVLLPTRTRLNPSAIPSTGAPWITRSQMYPKYLLLKPITYLFICFLCNCLLVFQELDDTWWKHRVFVWRSMCFFFTMSTCQPLNVQMASSSIICEFISSNDMATTMQLNDIANLPMFLPAFNLG